MTASFFTRRQRIARFTQELVSATRGRVFQQSTFRQRFPRQACGLALASMVTGAVAMPLLLGGCKGDVGAHSGAMVGLHEYRLLQSPIKLKTLSSNASGITYNPDTDTLFAISNNPTYIVEIDKQGRELRKITLDGFQDTEDLTYLGQNRYAIVEERLRTIVIATIGEEIVSVNRADSRSISLPEVTNGGNKGFEGIAYDPVAQSLYVVNEAEPRQLFRIDDFAAGDSDHYTVSQPWDLEAKHFNKLDFSALHYDLRTGHLLMLSDESRSLTESTLNGELVSRLTMSIFRSGFFHNIRQAEGVAMDHDGRLYVLSEPNKLYMLEPDRPSGDGAGENSVVHGEPTANQLQTGQKNPS